MKEVQIEMKLNLHKVLTFLNNTDSQVRISYRDNFAVIKIESAQKWHTGRWRLTASNPIGTSEVGLHFLVRYRP